ncbi:MAG: hydantoinase B/oxoprolinase family protein [Chloroflexi bacterium]|nr:hydantoinase B/oxoprolinase family protein [Chloroflexota bacterium]
MQLDPVTFEILRHRLWQVTDEMAVALSRVSGSPVTTDAGDYAVAIFTARGDVAVVGSGAPLHVSTTSSACKRILELFDPETDVEEGDMLLFNDPYRGCSHQPDLAIVAPLYHEGKLVAWSGTMTHAVDIGGMDSGAVSIRATSVYHEGVRFPGIKIVERGKLQKDVMLSIANMVREPGMVGLDLRAQIAANHVGHARLREIIGRFGCETIVEALVESLTYSETRLRARLRELPDGTWRHVEYLDHDGHTPRVYEARLAMTKEGDRLMFDFTGTSEQAAGFINSGLGATRGGIFCALIPMLAYDIPWNDGLLRPVELKVPEGTFLNPRFPAPVSQASTGGAYVSMNAASVTIGKMLGASEQYRDETFAVWRGGPTFVNLAGLNRDGSYFTTMLMDHGAGSGGARAFADGVDTGGLLMIPNGTCPNIERLELLFPVRYFFRRQASDTGGPGKYRGGMSGEYALVYDGPPGNSLELLFVGTGKDPAVSTGLFGGSPGCSLSTLIRRDSDAHALVAAGRLPLDLAEFSGELEDLPAKVLTHIDERDVLYSCWMGGGGYGDPLERDPRAVERDVALGLVSRSVAAEVYGVAIDPRSGSVNLGRTEVLRRAVRAARLDGREAGATPSGKPSETIERAQASRLVDRWGDGPRQRVSETIELRLEGQQVVATCSRCGHVYGPIEVHWKRRAVVAERPLAQVGPRMWPGSQFILREFSCPSCAVLADAEMTRPAEPFIEDEVRFQGRGEAG